MLTIAIALKGITDEILAEGLQVTSSNPLSGLSGRAALLRRLGSTLEESPSVFSQSSLARPGYMLGINPYNSNLIEIISFPIPAHPVLTANLLSLSQRSGMSLPSIFAASGRKDVLNSQKEEEDS